MLTNQSLNKVPLFRKPSSQMEEKHAATDRMRPVPKFYQSLAEQNSRYSLTTFLGKMERDDQAKKTDTNEAMQAKISINDVITQSAACDKSMPSAGQDLMTSNII